MKLILFISLISLLSCSTGERERSLASIERVVKFDTVSLPGIKKTLRTGLFLEDGHLRGCVLYLQGLGDSIRNHEPFFGALRENGYRVISFDYLGQGGSQGSMNSTRVSTSFPPDATRPMLRKYEQKEKYFEIGEQANLVWERLSKIENSHGDSCEGKKKIVIGWSTGGLATYKMAYEGKADGVILLAPGIHIKTMIGEAASNPLKLVFLQQVITERTLTRNKFKGMKNPHLDVIKPTSPAHIPRFSGNLFLTSKNSQHWKIPHKVKGLVFLSGKEDTYVDRDETISTLKRNASHFEVHSYDHSLHELDNEIEEVTDDLYERTILFLNSL